jgi:hypothetical protein
MSKYIGLIIKEFEQENKLDLKVVSTPASDVLFKVRTEAESYNLKIGCDQAKSFHSCS